MTVALIAIGVIVFLGIDGYVIYRVMSRHRTSGDYGSIPVPGETQILIGK